ncbi:MAG TPA: type IV pilin protein [Halomonas sp.]|nr:type IV pilin protein [Halomonas sp.]
MTSHRQGEGGFTLVELLIIVMVIGILAAVAIPAYYGHVERSRRSDAVTALMSLAQAQERFMASHGEYASSLNGSVAAGDGLGMPADNLSSEGFYTISLVRPEDEEGEYILTAAPRGSQASDAECGSFTLAHTGARGVTGTATVDDCW